MLKKLALYETGLSEHSTGQNVNRDNAVTVRERKLNYLESLYSQEGKTALVTGGASGIGLMIATALVEAGARVMIASRKGDACEAVAAQLNKLDAKGTAEGFAADLSSEDGITALSGEVASRTDGLDILVNNSGATWGAPIDSFPYAAWDKIMTLNVAAMFTLTRNLLPLLDKAASVENPARVINLGSVMGTVPLADGAYSYAVSKGAVHHMTKILANEFAARNITVNAFAPGPFQSRMTAYATASKEGAAAVAAINPLGRIGSPSDIAGATLFLCGNGGSYVTGAIIPLDGGISVSTGNMGIFPDG